MQAWFSSTRKAQRRDWGLYPAIPPNSEAGATFFGSRNVDLSHSTEQALQKVAVYAAVRLIRELVESLPIDFFSQPSPSQPASQIAPPKWMLDPAGDGYGLQDWMGQVAYSDALRGNVIATVSSRDTHARPTGLILHHPDDVTVSRDGEGGRRVWRIKGKEVDPFDIWHRRSFSIPGATMGLSPIAAHALTIGQGIAAAQYGTQWFTDGAHPSAILQNESAEKVDQKQAAVVKQRFLAAIRGRREPVVMAKGWTYTPIQIAAGDSMFLEAQGYTDAQCARIFGPGMAEMLGYETGGTMTYSNIEQRNLHLLTFTIDPWLVRFERMLYDLLPRPQFAKFNRGALLRTDLLTRYQAHQIALVNDFKVVNEVRALEDMQPVDWGDTPQDTKTPVPMNPAPSPASKGTP